MVTRRGSENNDPIRRSGYQSNSHGGLLGGVTTGMPLVCKVGFKPTSTINKPQQSVQKNLEEIEFLLDKGRHDPCVGVRAGVTLESRLAIELMNAGALQVEFCAQGILAERIRAGGAGLRGVLTDIAIDTDLARGKPTVEVDGQRWLIETALRADAALIHAQCADTFGNLRYAATARNFSPLMAMAANRVIVEAETVVETGVLDADAVHTPGPFVDHVVALGALSEEYGVVRRA